MSRQPDLASPDRGSRRPEASLAGAAFSTRGSSARASVRQDSSQETSQLQGGPYTLTVEVAAALRARHNWEQLAKFCAVGAVGYLLNLVVYDGLLHAGLHYLLAATCSFFVAVTSNYVWNRIWTFRDRRAGVAAQGFRFFLVALVSLVANLGVLHLLILGGVGKLLAQAAAIVIVTPLNFLGNRLWSFRHRA
jgi:putative flippase GtrA